MTFERSKYISPNVKGIGQFSKTPEFLSLVQKSHQKSKFHIFCKKYIQQRNKSHNEKKNGELTWLSLPTAVAGFSKYRNFSRTKNRYKGYRMVFASICEHRRAMCLFLQAVRACELLQKFCEYKHSNTCVIFASNSSKGQIWGALLN